MSSSTPFFACLIPLIPNNSPSSIPQLNPTTTPTTSTLEPLPTTPNKSRRTFLRLLTLLPLALTPPWTYSEEPPQTRTSLRELYESFTNLSTLLSNREYNAFRNYLRIPPLSNTRLSLSSAAMGLSDVEKKKKGLKEYRELMRGIEKVDGLALRASRNADKFKDGNSGEKGGKDEELVVKEFRDTVKLFDRLLNDLNEA